MYYNTDIQSFVFLSFQQTIWQAVLPPNRVLCKNLMTNLNKQLSHELNQERHLSIITNRPKHYNKGQKNNNEPVKCWRWIESTNAIISLHCCYYCYICRIFIFDFPFPPSKCQKITKSRCVILMEWPWHVFAMHVEVVVSFIGETFINWCPDQLYR